MASQDQECFLCSSSLTQTKDPETMASAKLYLQTLSELFHFEERQFQVLQEQARESNEDTSEQFNVLTVSDLLNKDEMIKYSNSLTRDHDNRCWENHFFNERAQVEGTLKVFYCEACIEIMHKILNTYKQLEEVERQVLQLKNQILKKWEQICINDNLEDHPKPLNTLRRELLEGTTLQLSNVDSSNIFGNKSSYHKLAVPNFNRRKVKVGRINEIQNHDDLSCKNASVQLTRLEDSPELQKYLEWKPTVNLNDGKEISNSNPAVDDIKNEIVTEFYDFEDLSNMEEEHDHFAAAESYYAPSVELLEMPTPPLKKRRSPRPNHKKKRVEGTIGVSDAEPSEPEMFPCCIGACNFTSNLRRLTQDHINKQHKGVDGQFMCDMCGVGFTRLLSLKAHLRRYHNYTNTKDLKYRCNECESTFTNIRYLKSHISKIHKRDTKYKCSTCSVLCHNNRTLEIHRRTHTNERPYICQHCGLTFKSTQYLKYHQGSKHPELCLDSSDINKYKCDKCDKIFATPINLRKHITSQHLKIFKFHCEICGRGCRNESNLQKHMVWHNDERNVECNICHAKFKSVGQLNIHTRRHTGDLKFKCNVCSKNFITNYALVRHTAIHDGVLKHFCSTCGKGFPVRNYLTIHMRSHETAEEKAARKINRKDLPPLQKLYHELRKKNKTVANVAVDPTEESIIQEFTMAYDHSRGERKNWIDCEQNKNVKTSHENVVDAETDEEDSINPAVTG